MTTSKTKIGLIIFGGNHPYFSPLKETMMECFKKNNIHLILRESTFSPSKQLEIINELIEKEKVCGLILSVANDEKIIQRINEIVDSGVPVITLHTDLPTSKRISYIGCDPYQSGQIAGGMMGLLTKGKAEVAIITGNKCIYAHNERIRGFEDKIKAEYPDIIINAISECYDDDYKCYEQVQKVMIDHPTINAFFFAAGGIYGGCKSIYQLTTRMSFSVITFGDVDAVKEFMKKDVIDASLLDDIAAQGEKALYVMKELLNAKTPVDEFYHFTNCLKIKECL